MGVLRNEFQNAGYACRTLSGVFPDAGSTPAASTIRLTRKISDKIFLARSWQAILIPCQKGRRVSWACRRVSWVHRRKPAEGQINLAYYVYIFRCSDGSFYVGSSKDIEQRVKVHNAGNASRYTRSRCPVSLVYKEKCESLGTALRRERQIKKWSRVKKEALISGDFELLTQLSNHRSSSRCLPWIIEYFLFAGG